MFIKQSYDEAFEHFILDMKDKYPNSLFQLNGIDNDVLDMTKFSQNYFLKKTVADASIDSNANVQINNVSTYKTEVHKGLDKLNSYYLLWKTARKLWNIKEANRLLEKEFNKELNIQDASHSYLSYCFAFDTYDLLVNGLPFVTNYPSDPPKHSDTFLQHTIQLIQYAAPQMMGATAIPNFLIIYAELLRQDSLNDKYPLPNYKTEEKLFSIYLKQRFQELVFLLNQPLRNGSQSTFTNITIFDSLFLKEMTNRYLIKGNNIDFDFAMFIQKEFLKEFNSMMQKRITTFPILTAQFKKDDEGNIEDLDFLNFIAEMNMEFGHINIYSDKSLTALSSCCRLINSIEDLIQVSKDENMNLIGGSSIKVGSFGVVTVNLVRIALLSKGNKDKFFELLKESACDAYKINHCRRLLIQNKIEQGQMPLYNFGFIDLNNQYSTLGINGFYEAVEIMGYDLAKDNINREGIEFSIELFKILGEISEEKIRKYGYRFNQEQIPAEQTALKLAQADKILYKQEKYSIYGNQFVPLTHETSIYNRINLQAEFEKYFSGGCIEENTKIMTSIGLIPIRDIVDNFETKYKKQNLKVYSFNEKTYETELKPILAAVDIEVEEKDKYEIQLEGNNDIITSSWHPFFIVNENMDVIEKRADELKVGDYVITNQTAFNGDISFSSDLAWLYGILITDGSYNIEDKIITFYNTNKDIIEHINMILCKYDIKHTVRRCSREIYIRQNSVDKIIEFLKLTKCDNKTFNATISNHDFLNWGLEAKIAFLSGVIDGDGNVPVGGKYIRILTASESFSNDLLALITSCGITASIKIEDGKYYYLKIPCNQYSKYLSLFKKFLQSKNKKVNRLNLRNCNGKRGIICSDSVKKQLNWKGIATKYNYKKTINLDSAIDINNKLSNVYGFFVKKIKIPNKTTKFCDLMIQDNHNYLAGNNALVYIHNTIIHINVGERIPTKKMMVSLIKDIVKKGVKYFAINYFFQKCVNDHLTLDDKKNICPICQDKIIEKYTRIVGFYVPYSSFSQGRKNEYDLRLKYDNKILFD